MLKNTIEHQILPAFPRTDHLPIEPNAQRNDLIASMEDLELLLNSSYVTIEEKIDGANCGMTKLNEYPVIRNRTHILNKSYTGNTKTPAKAQFASIWTWYYRNIDKFKALENILGYNPSVYGEWMYAAHTIHYSKLPDVFVAFDLYNSNAKKFYAPEIGRNILTQAGFATVPLLAQNISLSTEKLIELRDGEAAFTDGKREGIYIKVSDGEFITHRYKMVRPGFKQDENWIKQPLVRNQIVR